MFKKQQYRSFSKRLTRRIVLALALALIVVAASFNWIEADVFTRYYKSYCKILLDVKNETVRKALYGVEVAVINSTDDLEEQLQSSATVFNALRDELQRNPQIVGFFACFEPDYYPSQGRSFQPYAFWHDNRIDTMQIAKKGNDYLEDDWYSRALAVDSGYWSEPYMDDAGSGALMCTYSVPIHDHTGRKVGVFGADISLDWLHGQLTAIDKEYNFFKGFIENKRNIDTLSIFSSSIIIDSVGTFIVHPDKKRILEDNFYEALRQQKDTACLQLLNNMKAGKSGIDEATIDELKTTTAQKSAIESELAIARNIQMSMLPNSKGSSLNPKLKLHASMTPAKEVGGDLYDYFVRNNRFYFCIGDVAGKGVPAALVMTTVCGAFRLLAETETEPLRIVTRMNDMMTRDNSFTLFITFFAGVLDLDTDGLDEAENAQRKMFGKDRIKEVLQTTSPDPHTLIEQMTQTVTDFVGDTEQSDDLTMLALQYV